MTSSYNTGSNDEADLGDDLGDFNTAVQNGILTALTRAASNTDPITAATRTWGESDVGRPWLDISDPLNPIPKTWVKIDNTPTYGWRPDNGRAFFHLTTPASVTLSPAGPHSADVAFTAKDLSADLSALQGSDDEVLVREVILRVRVRTGASETLVAGSDTAYASFRTTGGTNEQRVYAHAVNRWAEQTIKVPLDSAESLDFAVVVGGGTAAFEVSVEILGYTQLKT